MMLSIEWYQQNYETTFGHHKSVSGFDCFRRECEILQMLQELSNTNAQGMIYRTESLV